MIAENLRVSAVRSSAQSESAPKRASNRSPQWEFTYLEGDSCPFLNAIGVHSKGGIESRKSPRNQKTVL